MFTLVTSNQEKIHFAKLALNELDLEFDVESGLHLIEIQADTPNEIIIHKAHEAFEQLKRPVVVSDHWWEISALNGFPGPYMRFINDRWQSDDLLRLMSGKKDRKAIFIESICYKDQDRENVFQTKLMGEVLSEARGKGLCSQEIISLSRDGKSIAWHLNNGTDPRGKYNQKKVWKDLSEWLRVHR